MRGVQVLIIEGLHPFFDERVAELCDYKIYLDITPEVKLAVPTLFFPQFTSTRASIPFALTSCVHSISRLLLQALPCDRV